MLGDKAYDSAELREELDERGTRPVIPNRSNRKQPFRFSKRLYKLRWRIEAAFNRLKDFRRIAEPLAGQLADSVDDKRCSLKMRMVLALEKTRPGELRAAVLPREAVDRE